MNLKNIETLMNEFKKIRAMGYVKSSRNGVTGVGKTFEDLLNKKEDRLNLPDYLGIEIKTKLAYSKSYTTLFNKTLDGILVSQNLCQKYGYPDKEFKNKKILNISINAQQSLVANHYYFSLMVDYEKEKIILIIKDKKGNLLENNACWSFNLLKEAVYTKLKYVALVYAWPTTRKNETYYKYYQIKFYELKGFNEFLKLVEKGIIRVSIKVGIYKRGPKLGLYHDRGTSFELKDNDFYQLFNRLYI